MAARRCSTCGVSWPNSSRYSDCPQCLVETDVFPFAACLPVKEAKELADNATFDRFYASWDADRERGEPRQPRPDPEHPEHMLEGCDITEDPDKLGRREAREILQMEEHLTLE